MNNTTKRAAAIASLISGTILLIAPLDVSARGITACPGLAVGPHCFVPRESARLPAQPVELTFDKTSVAEGVWQGTVDGDITGDLETRLTDVRVAGPIWHVRFDWIITAGDQSFVADLRGTLNNNTGAVVMDGTVVEGYLLGARVHEEGQLVDAVTLQFQGTIRLMPATG